MFAGRESELSELNRAYNSSSFEMPVIYGRRRVGKTHLISEFIKDKRAIYVQARRTNAQTNLKMLSQAILSENTAADGAQYSSFDEIFNALGELSKNERLIFVIDEFPYLAQSFPEICSLLQDKIDHLFAPKTKLMLILCGSSMSFIEEQVLGYESPLYGRRTSQLKIEPFDFFTANELMGKMKIEDAAVCYGITGGIPAYVTKINPNASLKENIKQLYLMPSSYLFEEPSNLLMQECRNPEQYDAIIQAMASGKSKISEIASSTSIPASNTKTYLNKLISLGVVKRKLPFGETGNKKAIYELCDQMFRFWFRFIPQNMGLIQNGMSDVAYSRIKDQLGDYMGSVFELICKQFIYKLARCGKLDVLPAKVDSWWGADKRTQQQEEIDIIVDDAQGSSIFCECKWRNEPTSLSVLEKLIHRSELFQRQNKKYMFFSKRGFTDACIKESAARGDVSLCTFKDMCKI